MMSKLVALCCTVLASSTSAAHTLEEKEEEGGRFLKRGKKCVLKPGLTELNCRALIARGCPFSWQGVGCGAADSGCQVARTNYCGFTCDWKCNLVLRCEWKNGKCKAKRTSTSSPVTAPPTTAAPTKNPTTTAPTQNPIQVPTKSPTTTAPTKNPTPVPTNNPTTLAPTENPTPVPTKNPTTAAPTTPAPTSNPVSCWGDKILIWEAGAATAGNLGGGAAADNTCKAMAPGKSLCISAATTFAFMSTGSGSGTHIFQGLPALMGMNSAIPLYVYTNDIYVFDVAKVFDDFGEFSAGSGSMIRSFADAGGGTLSASGFWSGVDTSGNPSANNCAGWTDATSSMSGKFGAYTVSVPSVAISKSQIPCDVVTVALMCACASCAPETSA